MRSTSLMVVVMDDARPHGVPPGRAEALLLVDFKTLVCCAIRLPSLREWHVETHQST